MTTRRAGVGERASRELGSAGPLPLTPAASRRGRRARRSGWESRSGSPVNGSIPRRLSGDGRIALSGSRPGVRRRGRRKTRGCDPQPRLRLGQRRLAGPGGLSVLRCGAVLPRWKHGRGRRPHPSSQVGLPTLPGAARLPGVRPRHQAGSGYLGWYGRRRAPPDALGVASRPPAAEDIGDEVRQVGPIERDRDRLDPDQLRPCWPVATEALRGGARRPGPGATVLFSRRAPAGGRERSQRRGPGVSTPA